MPNRKSILTLVLAMWVSTIGVRAMAQTGESSIDPDARAKIQERLQQISTDLNLTDAQKEQLKPILQDEVQQLRAVKDDTSLSPEQKQAKAQQIHQTSKSQMRSLLTPEQQQKLDAMKEQARENEK